MNRAKPKPITERLRNASNCDPECQGRCVACPDDLTKEAADEIERLTARLATLLAALTELLDFIDRANDYELTHASQYSAYIDARRSLSEPPRGESLPTPPNVKE